MIDACASFLSHESSPRQSRGELVFSADARRCTRNGRHIGHCTRGLNQKITRKISTRTRLKAWTLCGALSFSIRDRMLRGSRGVRIGSRFSMVRGPTFSALRRACPRATPSGPQPMHAKRTGTEDQEAESHPIRFQIGGGWPQPIKNEETPERSSGFVKDSKLPGTGIEPALRITGTRPST